MKRKRIPATDSIRELAEFWDTHDVTDFEAELEEVTEPVFEAKRGAVMRVRLRSNEAAAVNRLAKSRGIDCERLIEEWVREKVRRA